MKLLTFMMAILIVMSSVSALTIFNVHIDIPGTEGIYLFSTLPTESFQNEITASSRDIPQSTLPNGVIIQPVDSRFKGDGKPLAGDPMQISISTDKTTYNCNTNLECEVVNIEIQKTGPPLSEDVHLVIDTSSTSGYITQVDNFMQQGSKRFILQDPFSLPNGKKQYGAQLYAWGSGKFNISIIGENTGIVYQVLDPWFNTSFGDRFLFNVTTEFTATNLNHFIEVDTQALIGNGTMLSDCSDIIVTKGQSTNISHWIQEGSNDTINGCNTTQTKIWFKTNTTGSDIPDEHAFYFNNPSAPTYNSSQAGNDTFVFFDDFEQGTNISTVKWNDSQFRSDLGVIGIGDGLLTMNRSAASGRGYGVGSFNTATQTISGIYFNANYISNLTCVGLAEYIPVGISNTSCRGDGSDSLSVIDTSNSHRQSNEGSITTVTNNGSADVFHTYDLLRNQSNSNYFIDDVFQSSITTSLPDDLTSMSAVINNDNNGGSSTPMIALDYIFIYVGTQGTINTTLAATNQSVNGKPIITSPLENQVITGSIFTLNITLFNANETSKIVSIFFDGVLNSTQNISNGSFFNNTTITLPFGTHNISTSTDENSDFLIFTLSAVNATTAHVDPVNETTTNGFNITLDKDASTNISNVQLTYNNTLFNATLISNTSTQENYTVNATAPIIPINTTDITFNWQFDVATPGNSGTELTANETQTVHFAYFINSISEDLTNITEGVLFQSNTSVTDFVGNAVVTITSFMNDTTTNVATLNNTSAFNNTFIANPRAPQVSDPVLNETFNITHQISTTFEGLTRLANFSPDGQITSFKIFLDNGTQGAIESYGFITFNEDTDALLDLVDYNNIVVAVTHENSTITRNYSMQNLSADNLNIFIYPSDAMYIVNNSLTYDRENFSQRTTDLTNFVINNTFQQLNTYLANETTSFLVTLNVINGFNLGIPNTQIIIQRFSTPNNSFFNISVVNTNNDGQAFTNLILNDVNYRFILSIDDQVRLTEDSIITALSKTFRIIDRPQLIVGVLLGINSQCSYNNATNILTCTYNDTSGQLQNATLITTGINITGVKTQFCQETNASSSGILTCNITAAVNQNVSEVDFVLNVFIEDFEYELNRGIIILQSITNIFGVTGLLAALILILTMSLVGLNHPVTTVGGALIGIIASSILGLIPLQASFIIGLVVVGIILIIKMRN